jgi:hypothetical protein
MRHDEDETMGKTLGMLALLPLAPAAMLAHHGWGSYDASETITVEGLIETSRYANPHATMSATS